MPDEKIATLVIGGGQAGLVMSHRLNQRGLPHLVLERQRIGERWRSERWDGLQFQFPNWSVRLPDFPFPHSDPDGFAGTADIIKFIDAYAEFVAPPIRCGVEVTRLSLRDGGAGFVAETADGTVWIGTLGGLTLFGAAGLILGPIVVALFITIWEIYGSAFRDVLRSPTTPAPGPS